MTQQNPFFFGTESEFAILGQKAAREQFVRELSSFCKKRYPALHSRAGTQDLFLPWGRLYVDAGLHPEWATAEATDPWTVTYLQKVGELILSQIAKDFSEDIMISRHNVDSLSSTSWGHHENYLIHNHRKQKYAEILIPHLVTRTIYTGSGGLNIDFDKKTCQFVISPKASFLTSLIDHGSQYNRPLFHLKNEPLCRKYRRLHLICGENLYSELSRFLMVATTALLIILTDHQKTMPVCGTLLDEPLKSMQVISMDIGLKKKVKSKTSQYKRPLDIQWQYLEYVYSNIDQPFMPAWARFTCELWKKTLQKLEKGRASFSAELDWAIKLDLLEKKINEWGDSFFKQSSPLELAEEQLYELLQLELSFSQLGSQGLFRTLDNNGVLKHHVVGMPSICKEKMHQPPVMGRAAIRATAINRLSKQTEDHYLADWDKVVSYDGSKVLDLKAVERSNEDWSVRKTSIPLQLIKALKLI